MTLMNATEARRRLYGLVNEVAESHQPVTIAGKTNSAVLVSAEDWRAIEETLYLTSIPGMRKSIQRGMKTPPAKCRKDLPW